MKTTSQTVASRFFGILAASQSLEDGFGLAKQVCEVASLVGLVLSEVSHHVGLGSCVDGCGRL